MASGGYNEGPGGGVGEPDEGGDVVGRRRVEHGRRCRFGEAAIVDGEPGGGVGTIMELVGDVEGEEALRKGGRPWPELAK